jgi:hypothetical protein
MSRLASIGGAIAGLAAVVSVGAAAAADNEAGVPLTPAEAAGAWTVETGGHSICVLSLGVKKVAAIGYSLEIPSTCSEAVPTGAAAWAPAAGGMKLVSADGQTVLAFGRWSNSLFVSHRSSGVDIQLKRGAPNS